MGTPLIVLGWTALVLAGYLAGHPTLWNADWLVKAMVPPCVPWRSPFGAERGLALARSLATDAAWAAGIFAAGHRVARLIAMPAEEGALRLLLGLGTAALGWLGLGLAGLWMPHLAWVVVAAGVAVWFPAHFRGFAASVARIRPGWWFVLLLPIGWVTLAGATVPETEIDPVRYHLGLAERFVRGHRIGVPERTIFASFPLNVSMLYGSLELIGGPEAAKVFNWSLVWLGGWFAFTLAGGGWPGRVAVLAWSAVPVVWVHAGMAFAELGVTAFECGALLVLIAAVARGGGEGRLGLASGLLAGMALGCKYQAVQAVAPLFVLWALLGRRWTAVAAFAVAAGAVVAPWLVKNWVFTGNPVHPILSGRWPDLEDASAALAASRFRPEEVLGGGGILRWLAAPWTVGLAADRLNSYPFGPVLILSLPWLVAGMGGRSAVPAWYAVGFTAAWAASTAGWGRYLIGALPAWFAASSLAARRTDSRLPAGARALFRAGGACAIAAGWLLGASTIFQRQNPLEVAAGCVSADRSLVFRISPPRHALPSMRALCHGIAPGERFYAWGRATVAYVPRESHCDYEFDTPLFQRLVKASRDPAELRKRFRERGIGAFYYDLAGAISMSEVGRIQPWTPREIALWQDFFRLYGDLVVKDEVEGENVALYGWILRPAPAPAARLVQGTIWPHLPGLERALVEGDRLHARGDREAARMYYEGATRFLPGYAWAWQRLREVDRELGKTAEARRALENLRKLGG